MAGTGSAKPYLCNADNLARYAPRSWHSPGTAVDRSYEELDRIARTPGPGPELQPQPALGGIGAVDEPPRHAAPLPRWQSAVTAQDAAQVAGRNVWLMRPWHLADPPATLQSADGSRPPIVLAVLDLDVRARWPWSAPRWDFVAARLVHAAELRWSATARDLVATLGAARSLHGFDNWHYSPAMRAVPLTSAPQLFNEPERRCRSFSAFRPAAGRSRLRSIALKARFKRVQSANAACRLPCRPSQPSGVGAGSRES